MAALPALAGTNVDRSAVRVESPGTKRGEFAIPSPSGQRGLRQASEIGVTRIEQPLGFGNRQITYPRAISLLERLDTAPSVIGRNLAFPPRAVEPGFQDGQGPVCA